MSDRLGVIVRHECKVCGATVGNLHGSDCDKPTNRRVRTDQSVEYVPASQLRGAVEALQAVEDWFRRPVGSDSEVEVSERLDAVLAKVHAALGGLPS